MRGNLKFLQWSYEHTHLLECCEVLNFKQLLIFQCNMLPPSSGFRFQQSKTLKMQKASCSETSTTIQKATQLKVPKDLNLCVQTTRSLTKYCNMWLALLVHLQVRSVNLSLQSSCSSSGTLWYSSVFSGICMMVSKNGCIPPYLLNS